MMISSSAVNCSGYGRWRPHVTRQPWLRASRPSSPLLGPIQKTCSSCPFRPHVPDAHSARSPQRSRRSMDGITQHRCSLLEPIKVCASSVCGPDASAPFLPLCCYHHWRARWNGLMESWTICGCPSLAESIILSLLRFLCLLLFSSCCAGAYTSASLLAKVSHEVESFAQEEGRRPRMLVVCVTISFSPLLSPSTPFLCPFPLLLYCCCFLLVCLLCCAVLCCAVLCCAVLWLIDCLIVSFFL